MSMHPSKDFITLRDYGAAQLSSLLALALELKTSGDRTPYHKGKQVGMIFAVASTRTRVSFQVAAQQLGVHAESYNASDLHFSSYESIKDTAMVMSSYLDGLVVRMYDMDAYGQGRETLSALGRHAGIPIINALDDQDHPCQTLADLVTLRERFGEDFTRAEVLLTWGYAKRQKSPGVPHSMLTAAALLGMRLRIAHPPGFELDPDYLEFAAGASRESGADIRFCNDLDEACEGADVIYAKSWKSLSMTTAEDLVRREQERRWCVSRSHFDRARPGALYMDCMPFVRGEQVTAEIADGPQSIIYQQAANRLHAHKAILLALL